ncbi:hypothetical protein WJS89_11950 [Sphingomicrobium sp. XHP0235]|uniref:hypothetical protein n=1 Tax=Sphingomicrobium aquimarinum TaxID=3133971 RepID=UPI0031FE6DFD
MAKRSSKAATFDRSLKEYWDGDADDPFVIARFNWEEGEGSREPISPRFIAKRRPAAKEGSIDTAERVEVLLPDDAPDLLIDPDLLVSTFEASYPKGETLAFAQVTMQFADAPNLHSSFEKARAWCRQEFCDERQLPVLLVLHVPFRLGSANPPHVHAMVLSRQLTRLGWGKVDRLLASDPHRPECATSWFDLRTSGPT